MPLSPAKVGSWRIAFATFAIALAESGQAGAQAKPNDQHESTTEFDLVPIIGGSSDVGLGVGAVGALTRLAPDHFPTAVPTIGPQSLTYPLTYANALAILCVFGAILSLYFATSVRQTAVVRALGAAALPIFSVYSTRTCGSHAQRSPAVAPSAADPGTDLRKIPRVGQRAAGVVVVPPGRDPLA